VIHKAGGSNSGRYTDSQYLTNVPRIRAAGLPLGHYWFNGEGDPTADADYFVANLASWDRSDLLALDVEGESGTAGTPWTPDKAKAFCDRVLARTGVHPHVYMSASVTRQAGWDALAAAGYPLWVASYGSNSGKPESLPTIGGWSDWNGWQYTSLFPGVGDMSEFKQFAGAVPVAPGTTTPVPPASSDSGYNASNRSTSWIQTQLNAIGHYGLVVDGIYGPATTAAVADYQHVHGLEVDGIAGNQTVSSLAGVTSPGLAVDGLWGLLTTKALQRAVGADPDGIIGPDTITKLQQHLGITADGINGPQTHVALQARVGAEQDGIWGPETARKLQIALNAGSF
jgi:peptidoglycan hydrolase-like protein with peptidoglycan-binding domain